MPSLEVKSCLKNTNALQDLYFGKLYGKLSTLMMSHEMRNANMTMQQIYEIDELTLKVLADSDCDEAQTMTAFKLLEADKEPIAAHNLTFKTANNVTVDLHMVPYFISRDQAAITEAYATNSTKSLSEQHYNIGKQLGMATKLFQLRGKDTPNGSKSYWIIGAIVLFVILAFVSFVLFR